MALVHRVGWDSAFVARNPWLWPLGRAAGYLRGRGDFPDHAELDALYSRATAARSAPALYFRADASRRRKRAQVPPAERYDGRITLAREVPTRVANWHDLLNALCFATFPHAKTALHGRQYRAAVARAGAPAGARSREQDALTLFDEGGVVVAARPAALAEARAALTAGLPALRALEQTGQARVVPFGHALFEHMVEGLPCPGAWARLLPLPALPAADAGLLAAVDAALCAELGRASRFTAPEEGCHLRLW